MCNKSSRILVFVAQVSAYPIVVLVLFDLDFRILQEPGD